MIKEQHVIWKTSKYLFENQGKNKLELCVSENVCRTTFILIHGFKYQCENYIQYELIIEEKGLKSMYTIHPVSLHGVIKGLHNCFIK